MNPARPFVVYAEAIDEIEKRAVRIRLGRGQVLNRGQTRPVLIVRSGHLVVRIDLPDGRCIGTLLVPPHGMVRLASIPAMGSLSVAAGQATVLLRLEEETLDQMIDHELAVRQYVLEEAKRQFAYDTVHIALLTSLTSEERVAVFFMELSRLLGRTCGGSAVALPVSRTELANHLGLNPDTLSRVLSRFKSQGLIATQSRGTISILNAEGLARLNPALHA